MSSRRPLGEELEELFSGPLASAAGKLVPPGTGSGFRPAAELHDPSTLRDVLDRFARGLEGDPRALASLWSQWYLGALVVPALAAGLRLDRTLPLGAGTLEVRLDGDRRPVAFRLPHGGEIDPDAGPFRRFRPLIRDHLEPLVEALAAEAGLSTALLWCNAARYVQWTLGQLEGPGARATAGPAPGRRLLEAETRPDGRPNPLHGRVGRVPADSGREVARRKICCLRFLVDGVDDCDSLCPLPEVRRGTGRGDRPAG